MTVTVDIVLSEVTPYIPEYNVLTQTQMEAIASSLITKHGNDDSKLGVIKCEFLKILGYQNSVISSINPSGIRSERLGDHQITYTGNGAKVDWNNYIKNVGEVLCPLFGVETPFTLGTSIRSTQRNPVLTDCSTDDLIL